jgi:phosphatidylserine/phosphatidylglycerophosphate/cardiolipin synthase-like enzyme
VHHNFVQRWNEASERTAGDGLWGDAGDALAFPNRLSEPRGRSLVQIQRMVHADRYTNGEPTPGGHRYNIAAGEHSILDQYKHWIATAKRAIYIENQALPIPGIAAELEKALERGIELVMLVPAEPEQHVRRARQNPDRRHYFERIEALGRHDNFCLAGIAAPTLTGRRRNIYVHSKLMLVDDELATIGSCNLHANSLSGHTEMNAAVSDRIVVRALRRELLQEHLGQDTAHLDARAASQLYRSLARENRLKQQNNDFDWQGMAFALVPEDYGR